MSWATNCDDPESKTETGRSPGDDVYEISGKKPMWWRKKGKLLARVYRWRGEKALPESNRGDKKRNGNPSQPSKSRRLRKNNQTAGAPDEKKIDSYLKSQRYGNIPRESCTKERGRKKHLLTNEKRWD